MAYDEVLADRIRELLAGERDVIEKTMFGGLAFLIGGHMAIAASREGGVLVRVDPASSADLVAKTAAEPMVMRGRPMQAWVRVADPEVRTRRQLETWVRRGTAAARAMPVKQSPRRTRR